MTGTQVDTSHDTKDQARRSCAFTSFFIIHIAIKIFSPSIFVISCSRDSKEGPGVGHNKCPVVSERTFSYDYDKHRLINPRFETIFLELVLFDSIF